MKCRKHPDRDAHFLVSQVAYEGHGVTVHELVCACAECAQEAMKNDQEVVPCEL